MRTLEAASAAVRGGSNLVTIGKNGRVYPRKFDHEDAKRRFKRGESIPALAAEYGVTYQAVRFAVDRRAHVLQELYLAEWQSGICACGAKCSGNRYQQDEPRCLECAADARATSVRETELQCQVCQRWLADDDFPCNRHRSERRRGRHKVCRACGTELKRDYRNRNKVPCSTGCGALVDGKNRRDNTKPYECIQCVGERRRRERVALVEAA